MSGRTPSRIPLIIVSQCSSRVRIVSWMEVENAACIIESEGSISAKRVAMKIFVLYHGSSITANGEVMKSAREGLK